MSTSPRESTTVFIREGFWVSLCRDFSTAVKDGHCDVNEPRAQALLQNELSRENIEFLQSLVRKDLHTYDAEADGNIFTQPAMLVLQRYTVHLMQFLNADTPRDVCAKILMPLEDIVHFFKDCHAKAIESCIEERDAFLERMKNEGKVGVDQEYIVLFEDLGKEFTPMLGLIVASAIGHFSKVGVIMTFADIFKDSVQRNDGEYVLQLNRVRLLYVYGACSPFSYPSSSSIIGQGKTKGTPIVGEKSLHSNSSVVEVTDDEDFKENNIEAQGKREEKQASQEDGEHQEGENLDRSDQKVLMACAFLQYMCEFGKKENPANWSIASMQGPWFDEAVRFYNTHFDEFGCNKKVTPEMANNLRKKVDPKCWLRQINEKTKHDPKHAELEEEVKKAAALPVETLREQFIRETYRLFPSKQKTHSKWMMIFAFLIKRKKMEYDEQKKTEHARSSNKTASPVDEQSHARKKRAVSSEEREITNE